MIFNYIIVFFIKNVYMSFYMILGCQILLTPLIQNDCDSCKDIQPFTAPPVTPST